MSRSDRLREWLSETVRLPELDGGRCVHARIETGTCRACEAVCPHGAWVLDDEQLGLLPDRCDGCGRCVPACPEGAISQAFELPLKQWNGQRLVLACCDRAPPPLPGDARLPCLHAIGLAQLTAWYRAGCRHLFVLGGDCAQCPRNGAPTLAQTVRGFNRLLRSRAAPPMAFHPSNAMVWRRVHATATDPDSPADRRQFLRRALVALVDQANRRDEPPKPAAPAAGLPPSDAPAALYPVVPVIDERQCDGCDACVNLCPHRALRIESGDDGSAYRIDPSQCTGCGICRDVCDAGAIELRRFAPLEVARIGLWSGNCEACGAPFHHPADSSRDRSRCLICARKNHHRQLFQVIE